MRVNMKSSASRQILLWVVVIASVTAVIVAQSGRRSTRKSPVPASSPTPAATETPKPAPKGARVQLFVGIDDPDMFSQIPLRSTGDLLDGCVRRLDSAAGVAATGTTKRMLRVDAVNAAKAEKERYVVWLQMGSELADASAAASNRADTFYVNFFIFEPVTAKVKGSGRTYNTVYQTGNIGVSPPARRGSPQYNDFLVKQLAQKTADRILSKFDIRKTGADEGL